MWGGVWAGDAVRGGGAEPLVCAERFFFFVVVVGRGVTQGGAGVRVGLLGPALLWGYII